MRAGEYSLILFRQVDAGALGRPAPDVDPCRADYTQRGKPLGADTEYRDGPPEQLLRHDHPECDDRFGPLQHDCRRPLVVQQQFQHDAAAGAGTAAGRQRKDAAGERLAAQRMVPVDHLAGQRIDPAPEAEAHIAEQDRTFGGPRHHDAAGDRQGLIAHVSPR
jgi:hypothetical protein